MATTVAGVTGKLGWLSAVRHDGLHGAFLCLPRVHPGVSDPGAGPVHTRRPWSRGGGVGELGPAAGPALVVRGAWRVREARADLLDPGSGVVRVEGDAE